MKEGWKKEFRDSLSGYSEPAPEGLFEDIMASYEAASAKSRDRRRVLAVILPGLAAAAAITVAVIFGDGRRGNVPETSGTQEDTYLLAETGDRTVQGDAGVPAEAGSIQEMPYPPEYRGGEPAHTSGTSSVPVNLPDEDRRMDVETPVSIPSGAEEVSSEEDPAPDTGHSGTVSGQEESGQVDIIPQDPYDWQHILLAENDRPARKHGTSFNIYASGLSGGGSSHTGYSSPVRAAAMVPMSYGDNSLAGIMTFNRTKDVSTDYEHFLPLRVGLTFSYWLTPRWSIETGLTYSWLLSKSRTGSDSYYVDSRQELHYLGIPLNISYNVWDSRWMRVYFSAGGMLEKCVGGSFRSDFVYSNDIRDRDSGDLMVRPLQWSCSASAGIQVNLSSLLGIYLEPGASYHFRNGSDIESVYSEHPFNFNLNLGLRFSFR